MVNFIIIHLAGNSLGHGGQEPKGPLGLKAPVTPQPMSPTSDSQSTKEVNENSYV